MSDSPASLAQHLYRPGLAGGTWPTIVTRELAWTGTVTRVGTRSSSYRRVSEWLILRGHLRGNPTPVFSSAVQRAVRAFQTSAGLPVTGVLDEVLFAALTAPLRAAAQPLVLPAGTPLGAAAVAAARQHIAQRPREVGGPNAGPWVRAYMNGAEGARWSWCAGFLGTVVRQGALAIGSRLPFEWDNGVPSIVRHARETGRFLRGEDVRRRPSLLGSGAIFMVRPGRGQRDYVHTGLVLSAISTGVLTAEGNTTRTNSADGIEALLGRWRWDRLDFARLDG